jgi:hypothetical protein
LGVGYGFWERFEFEFESRFEFSLDPSVVEKVRFERDDDGEIDSDGDVGPYRRRMIHHSICFDHGSSEVRQRFVRGLSRSRCRFRLGNPIADSRPMRRPRSSRREIQVPDRIPDENEDKDADEDDEEKAKEFEKQEKRNESQISYSSPHLPEVSINAKVKTRGDFGG